MEDQPGAVLTTTPRQRLLRLCSWNPRLRTDDENGRSFTQDGTISTVELPEGDILRNGSGKPIVRIFSYLTPKAHFGFVIPRGCARSVPRTATDVQIQFFDRSSHQPIGMEPGRTPPKPSLGLKMIKTSELDQFTVTC